jgi:hypothetical protein
MYQPTQEMGLVVVMVILVQVVVEEEQVPVPELRGMVGMGGTD